MDDAACMTGDDGIVDLREQRLALGARVLLASLPENKRHALDQLRDDEDGGACEAEGIEPNPHRARLHDFTRVEHARHTAVRDRACGSRLTKPLRDICARRESS